MCTCCSAANRRVPHRWLAQEGHNADEEEHGRHCGRTEDSANESVSRSDLSYCVILRRLSLVEHVSILVLVIALQRRRCWRSAASWSRSCAFRTRATRSRCSRRTRASCFSSRSPPSACSSPPLSRTSNSASRPLTVRTATQRSTFLIAKHTKLAIRTHTRTFSLLYCAFDGTSREEEAAARTCRDASCALVRGERVAREVHVLLVLYMSCTCAVLFCL